MKAHLTSWKGSFYSFTTVFLQNHSCMYGIMAEIRGVAHGRVPLWHEFRAIYLFFDSALLYQLQLRTTCTLPPIRLKTLHRVLSSSITTRAWGCPTADVSHMAAHTKLWHS